MEYKVKEITDIEAKTRYSRSVLEQLPDWFEIEESREAYIRESTDKIFFCAFDGNQPVGFLYLKETGKDTAELAVMGVLKEYHRCGIGRLLFQEAKHRARQMGYSFMQVKTVRMGIYDNYDKTNLFYRSLGFKEFEVFTTLWDKANPCQVYVMSLQQ